VGGKGASRSIMLGLVAAWDSCLVMADQLSHAVFDTVQDTGRPVVITASVGQAMLS
jgi:hypothetical protein